MGQASAGKETAKSTDYRTYMTADSNSEANTKAGKHEVDAEDTSTAGHWSDKPEAGCEIRHTQDYSPGQVRPQAQGA